MRKEDRLMDLLGQLDDSFLVDLDDEVSTVLKEKRKKTVGEAIWFQGASLAAAAVLTLIIARTSLLPEVKVPPFDSTLPILHMDYERLFAGGLGYEGLMGKNIEEIHYDAPWESGDFDTLPVFQNAMGSKSEVYTMEEKLLRMKKTLLSAGERVGVVIQEEEILVEWVQEDYPIVSYESEEHTISVNPDLSATIQFKTPVMIPNDLRSKEEPYFEQDSSMVYPTLKEKLRLSEYFAATYGDLLMMNYPETAVEGGDRNIYGKRYYHVFFYEGSEDPKEKFLNYFFSRTYFNALEMDELSSIAIFHTDLSQKVGEYPIISEREARDLLVKGNYVSSVPEVFPGRKYIRRVELVYRTGYEEELFMPYYRILVEVPALKYEGMNTYGAYYVPAVRSEYLLGLPTYDGSFN
ncbi:MAG TPA: hypothetical protein DEF30_06210 [Proteiniclasticum sp.]|uniref:hypothetical protein n=1 Tax=Proteiniclasticum sp. TaxID=2053595 RepID=UPI000E8B7C10|nr:hypothetical protein [Proteiniclasticum sp.]HBW13396.1 hypothetical protein [Proteiniclasticum sp.]